MNLGDILKTHSNSYRNIHIAKGGIVLTASFVIPVYNSSSTIGHTIRSIAAQERADLIKQVILINDGSTDNGLITLKELTKQFPELNIITIDNKSRKYAAYSRNKGIKIATSDLVCFIDSDIVLPRDYFVTHAGLQQANGPIVCFSLRHNVANVTKAKFPFMGNPDDFRYKIIKDNPVDGANFDFSDTHSLAEMCLTCAVTYRRDDLELVKGCPNNFVGWGFNDTAMAAKVIALGRSVAVADKCVVYHIVHAPRSGGSSKKWTEFSTNKRRYEAMLAMRLEDTFRFDIPALNIDNKV